MRNIFTVLCLVFILFALQACAVLPTKSSMEMNKTVVDLQTFTPPEFKEIFGPPNLDELPILGAPGSIVSCQTRDDGTETCSDYGYSFNAVRVPKYAAPFQVQIATTQKYATDKKLREAFPERGMWEMRHVCGGALIDKQWVLTAAHCFKDYLDPKYYNVRLDIGVLSEASSKHVPIERIFVHPKFDLTTLENDIALLKINPEKLNIEIEPFSPYLMEANWDDDIWDAKMLTKPDRIWTYGADKVLSLWNPKTGKNLFNKSKSNGEVVRISNNRLLGFNEEGAWMINAKTGKELAQFSHRETTSGVVVSKDKKQILTWGKSADNQYDAKIWNLSSQKIKASFPHPNWIIKADFISPNRLVTVDVKGTVRLWDSQSKVLLTAIESASSSRTLPTIFNNSQFSDSQFSDSLAMLIAGGLDIVVVDVRSGKTLNTLTTPLEYFPSNRMVIADANLIGVSKDGRYAITQNGSRWLLVWDLKTGQLHKQIKKMNMDIGMEYDPYLNQIIMSSLRGPSEIWSATTGTLIAKIPKQQLIGGETFSFFAQGTRILHWSYDGITKVFNASTGEEIIRIDHSLPVSNVSLSDDEQFILSYSDYGTAEVWNTQSGNPVSRVFHGGTVSGTQLLRNGKLLLSWGSDGTAKVWDVKKGKEIYFVRHLENIETGPAAPRRQHQRLTKVSVAKFSNTQIDLSDDTTVTTYGWGKTKPVRNFQPSSVLRTIALNVISTQSCLELGGWKPEHLDKGVFCAYSPRRKTCYGDSGSPVMGNKKVVGIVSWGSGLCGEDSKPSVYTNVPYFSKWINEQICTQSTEAENRPKFCEDSELDG